jgi:hypothetical protein
VALALVASCTGEIGETNAGASSVAELPVGAAAPGVAPVTAANPGVAPAQPVAPVTQAVAPTTAPGSTNTVSGLGYVELPDGRGGVNVERVSFTEAMGFDKARSLEAFRTTVYAITSSACAACHSTANRTGSGAQAPLHADVDVSLAHEYALTRVNLRDPAKSKLVERMGIDRHNCFAKTCAESAAQMTQAITMWRDAISDMISEVPRGVAAETKVSDQEVLAWIQADQAALPAEAREFIKYASLHQLHNSGASALDLNHARVGLSKTLNSTARWAPAIANPVDVNGKGMVYRFDIRDYWGHSLIDTSDAKFKLYYGGSDDDLAFGSKVDVDGKAVAFSLLTSARTRLKPSVTPDEKFARLVWARVLRGNVEGAGPETTLPPNIDGFIGTKVQGGNGEQMVKPEDLQYVDALQLVYTLTRPDVYNAIMAIPGYAQYLEDELKVDRSSGMDSYDYVLTYEAITIDSRLLFRGKTPTGYYWKTFDIFTDGNGDVDEMYQSGRAYFPIWSHPIPAFINNSAKADDLSTVALLPLQGERVYDPEKGGGQAMAEESLWSMPNGMQGTALFGAFNQRRVDAFTLIVRDPRIFPKVDDKDLDNHTGFGREIGVADLRLNTGSSCIGCHTDGMNRLNNSLRDWIDEDSPSLEIVKAGVDQWIDDAKTVARVRELYPPSADLRRMIEDDRRLFLGAMAKIQQGMALGVDKNVYIEPTIWMIEAARKVYGYKQTISN